MSPFLTESKHWNDSSPIRRPTSVFQKVSPSCSSTLLSPDYFDIAPVVLPIGQSIISIMEDFSALQSFNRRGGEGKYFVAATSHSNQQSYALKNERGHFHILPQRQRLCFLVVYPWTLPFYDRNDQQRETSEIGSCFLLRLFFYLGGRFVAP